MSSLCEQHIWTEEDSQDTDRKHRAADGALGAGLGKD